MLTARLPVQGHRCSRCSVPGDEGAGFLAAQGDPGALRGAVQEAQGRAGHGAVHRGWQAHQGAPVNLFYASILYLLAGEWKGRAAVALCIEAGNCIAARPCFFTSIWVSRCACAIVSHLSICLVTLGFSACHCKGQHSSTRQTCFVPYFRLNICCDTVCQDSHGEVLRLIDTFRIAAEESVRMYGEARGNPATAQLPATCTKRFIAQWFCRTKNAVHRTQSCTFLRDLLGSSKPTNSLSSNPYDQVFMHAEYSQCHLHCMCMYTSNELPPAASLLS